MSRFSTAGLLAALMLLPATTQAVAEESLERQIGRMLLVGTRGSEVTAGGDFEKLVCGLKVGGLLLFDKDVATGGTPRNVLSTKQLTRLTRDLRKLARGCGNAPLLIAADVEGGVVNRLRPVDGLRRTIRHASLGRGSARRTRRQAARMAKVMADTGVNWDLAPVVDLNLNPDSPAIGRWGRSFSADPEKVTLHARAFIEGLDRQGVLNCIKHFPGHGSSTDDSHQGAVDVSATSRPELELAPYRTLIGEGIVDCVMIAHIYNRKIDPHWMATLSSAAICGILRSEMGFDGVVLSDDLQMFAITHRYSLERAAVLAVAAGTDMLTLGNNRNLYDDSLGPSVHRALVEAVRRGDIPIDRIREANGRIKRLKAQLPSENP